MMFKIKQKQNENRMKMKKTNGFKRERDWDILHKILGFFDSGNVLGEAKSYVEYYDWTRKFLEASSHT